MKVAVGGAGIAGLGAARALIAAGVDVTIFEAAARPGGHVYTVEAEGHAVDMGFIVCNRDNYPRFFRLLQELGIETRATTMSFSVSLPYLQLEWGSESLSALFADRRRLFDARHWRFLVAVMRFLRAARRDLARGAVAGLSLDEYLATLRLGRGLQDDLRERFIVPLAAALWSLAPDHCGEFPAESYLGFLDQHGMLAAIQAPAWRTVVGGSRRYVDALVAQFPPHALRCATPVARVHRDAGGVTVVANGEHRFDRLVVATPADVAISLLAEPTADERSVLGAFRYSINRTVLHRDASFLPRHPAAHAAWNYVADPDTAQVAVTYSMTRLQGLPSSPPFLVTLNPRSTPDHVLHEVAFSHPQFDRAALAAQGALPLLGRSMRTAYCGAHSRFGFHEDGLRSGQLAAERTLADAQFDPAAARGLFDAAELVV
ncbi:NAD(P)/FAD-dependent oxidoreductase [soil metagenome]